MAGRLSRLLKPAKKPETYLPFRQATGMRYVTFLEALHSRYLFDWYMEIGCRTGRIFAPVRGKTIAVDPFFQAEVNIIGTKPALHVFQATSDDFFASGFLAKNDISLSFSFLDGMHLFEFLLRDFISAERQSKPEGIIALHDCCPFGAEMTTRDLKNLPPRAWTGDVWKLLPILRKYRPDLIITVLDCAPTGLVLVSGLSPESDVLSKAYDEILAAYTSIDIMGFGVEAFYASFEYTDTATYLEAGAPHFATLALDAAEANVPIKITP